LKKLKKKYFTKIFFNFKFKSLKKIIKKIIVIYNIKIYSIIYFSQNGKKIIFTLKIFSHFSVLPFKYAILIAGICLLIVAIIIGIGIALYIRRWRKKNDLELLGYPPKVPPSSRSNLSSTSIR
jgi:ABC-type phosphate transport system permease subunit